MSNDQRKRRGQGAQTLFTDFILFVFILMIVAYAGGFLS